MADQKLCMVVDTKACVACNTCAIACKVENNLPDDVWWNKIMTVGGQENETPEGVYPNLSMYNITFACQHCENPACVKVCPVGATYKDGDTGVVRQDYDKCIGCRMCMAACPYTGVRSFNWDEPKYQLDFPVGGAEVPTHQKHVVEKCTFCNHRLAKGMEPACVYQCPARARFFGDLNDPESMVSGLLIERDYIQLLPEQGTNPSVYFLK